MSFGSSKITNKFLRDLLGKVIKDVPCQDNAETPDVATVWKLLVGEKIAALTEVKSFYQGILVIKVSSSSLNHLLSTTEKPKILLKLKTQYSYLKVKALVFKTG